MNVLELNIIAYLLKKKIKETNRLKIGIIPFQEIKKDIKRAYAKNKYHSMNNEELQRHKEYQKNYQKMYREKKKQELENIK